MRQQLYRWFRKAGRDLPWRRTKDPYAILVSEFMLQQTTVTAVVPYFERWMKRFPSVCTLAEADEHDVLTLWQGLGYYSRARNLHATAREIMERHAGKIPASRSALRELPGVGDYTAGAVASFAFDAVEPVIDANIARVLARLENWRQPIDDAAGKLFLEKSARAFLPKTGGTLHTSAIMELGALICGSRQPQCPKCPVRGECLAEEPASLPIKKTRPITLAIQDDRTFIYQDHKVWLELSTGPRWKGLWVLPVATQPGRTPAHTEIFPITRYRVTMRIFATSKHGQKLRGFSPDHLPPMPSPHRRAVAALLKKRHSP